MLKKVILLTLAIALLATSFVFADDSQSTLSKLTGLSDQEIQTLYQNRTGYGKILTASIVAKITNTNIKDVLASNQAGTTFAKIAEEKGIKLEDYKSAVLKGKTDYIDEQVKAGTLTEAQANIIKERMQQRIQACDGQNLNRGQGFGPGSGMRQRNHINGLNGSGAGFNCNGAGFNNSIFNQ